MKTTRSERNDLRVEQLKSLGGLTENTARALSNLLTDILQETDILMTELGVSTGQHASAQRIETCAQQAAELVEQLLFHSGAHRLVNLPFDLSETLTEMRSFLALSLPRTATLKLNLGLQLPHVAGDIASIRQLILEVVEAVGAKLPEDDSRVILSTGARSYSREELDEQGAERLRSGTLIHLSATIDPSPGPQGEPIDPSALAEVQAMARDVFGHARIVNRSGRSALVVLLPSAPRPATGRTLTLAAGWHEGGKVLVVEPDEAMQGSQVSAFEQLGFEVVVAPDVSSAGPILRARAAELVLVTLDIDAIVDWEEFLAEIPAGVQTALTCRWSTTPPERGLWVLHKPFRIAELREKLQELLRSGE